MSPTAPAGLSPGGRFEQWLGQAPRYVVADVDGPLVGRDGMATASVVDACRDTTAAGVPVGFATGRMGLAVQGLWEQLRIPGPHVLHNGAEVRHLDETVAAWPLSSDHLARVLAIAERLDVYVELYTADGYAVSRRDERARPHWELLGIQPSGVVTAAHALGAPALKATFGLFDGDDVDGVVSALRQAGLSAGPATSPVTPEITYVNATEPTVNKGAALRAAAAHLGIAVEAVVAIGDAHNDLPLLASAGTAIAMGQADPEVRAAAHLVAPTVDDNGVARVLAWVRKAVRPVRSPGTS